MVCLSSSQCRNVPSPLEDWIVGECFQGMLHRPGLGILVLGCVCFKVHGLAQANFELMAILLLQPLEF